MSLLKLFVYFSVAIIKGKMYKEKWYEKSGKVGGPFSDALSKMVWNVR